MKLPVWIDPTAYPIIKAKKNSMGRYPENGSNDIVMLLQIDHANKNQNRNLSYLSNKTPAEMM